MQVHWFCSIIFILEIIANKMVCVTPPTSALKALPNRDPFSGEMEDLEFRVFIEPYKVECFYQNVYKDHVLEITYQVIEMASRWQWLYVPSDVRDLTIDFKLIDSSSNNVIIEEFAKQEGSHTHEVKQNNSYKICFDNSRSPVSMSINLEVYLYSLEDDDRWGYFEDDFTYPPDIVVDESLETIKASVNKVRDYLIKVEHYQNERQAIERRDRIIAEKNFNYINRFSFLSVLFMIILGVLQIVIIRSLFEEKSFIKRWIK
ncbi:transmembrane emp24 domain-containing protein 1-like protein [Dinothrombium tinctorium]|uniref:Transmembrane emp24 domain-containing protein 1-like protein n=1 Tax=Dinothrombium tinctorium TaxID=1965070 RepID=A0A3S3SQ45_9ACAR|nr:transmembrane emp24 domain-containing protein 1-like protein [Dinothrombium tinctorium]